MRFRSLMIGFAAAVLAALSFSQGTEAKAASGFDELGYNRTARIFRGKADGVDGVLDGKVYGDPTYANDFLEMKWSADWDKGKAEGWAGSYPDAWLTNEWNGQCAGGSGEIWQYAFLWVGALLEDSEYWRPGGYDIWNIFETIRSHGIVGGVHIWDTKAGPCGFGSPN